MSVNKVILVGNLGRDPEVRHLPTGMKVANFSVATTFKRKTGEQTEWHNIVAFDRLADLAEKYLRKGKQIYLEGRLQTRQWEAKDGSGKRQRTEIIMSEMQFLGGRGQGDGEYAGAGAGASSAGGGPDMPTAPIDDEDIPF
jgi:single-strand DNA-binding protein